MMVEILHRRRSCGPTLPRLVFGMLCLVWLSCSPAGPAVAAGDDENFFTHLHAEKAMANVTVSPGRSGPVDITIQLETMEEKPQTAKAVSVTLSRPGEQPRTIEAAHTSDDQWQVKIPNLAAGRWTLGLGISTSATEKISVEAPILIK